MYSGAQCCSLSPPPLQGAPSSGTIATFQRHYEPVDTRNRIMIELQIDFSIATTGRLTNAGGRGISAGVVDTSNGSAEVMVTGTL